MSEYRGIKRPKPCATTSDGKKCENPRLRSRSAYLYIIFNNAYFVKRGIENIYFLSTYSLNLRGFSFIIFSKFC